VYGSLEPKLWSSTLPPEAKPVPVIVDGKICFGDTASMLADSVRPGNHEIGMSNPGPSY